MKLTLDLARKILPKHVTEEHLLIHAAAVSSAMESMAGHFGMDDVEKDHWAAIGFLHDVDYEKFPNEHCHHVRELLEPENVDEDDIKTIISHGFGSCTDEVEPVTDCQKSLYAVDELTGIIHAYALMRPENFDGMNVKSLKKKFKDKKFAAGCKREVIQRGADMLQMDLGDIMQICIDGMSARKSELGF